MTTVNSRFDATAQLQELIRRYPDDLKCYGIKIDIYGVILDYLAKSGNNVEDLLTQNPSLYRFLFPADQPIPDSTLMLMEAILKDRQSRSSARTAANRHDWKVLSELIDQIDNKDKSKTSAQPDSRVDRLAHHRVAGVVWQLSDIHFGPLNNLKKEPEELAQTLGQIVRDDAEFMPRFIIISGDVSSSAGENELTDFVKFCELLSDEVWGQHCPGRILVVPGNHETTWQGNGTADKLQRFQELVAKGAKVVSPFWPIDRPNYSDNLGRVAIHRFDSTQATDNPPFALVHDKAIELRILLLVSSYYSGSVPRNIRTVLEGIRQKRAKGYLMKLLREDTGEFTNKYLSEIERGIWTSSDMQSLQDSMTIAVTHHNLYQYTSEICSNSHAPHLLSLLAGRQIQLVLHGHTHLAEDLTRKRPVTSGEAYPVPCPTLCGEPVQGSLNGFMMHLIGPVDDPRRVSSAVWTINDLGRFDRLKAHLHVRYRFKVQKNHLHVTHVSR